MSTLKTNYINNLSRVSATDAQKNLQLGSDGSVTSYEGLSISDAAAANGINYKRKWNNTNISEIFAFDRTKYNTMRIKGWVDLSYEPSNAIGIGLYIQPCIGGTPYAISQLNGGTTGTFTQISFDVNLPPALFDQMVYNTAGVNNGVGYRWIIDHEITITETVVWTTPRISTLLNLANSNIQSVVRELAPQAWGTTLGNQINGFKVSTNSLTGVSTVSRGMLSISICRDAGYLPA